MLEDPPLHQPPGQEHEQGQGQRVAEISKLCKHVWVDGGVVDMVRLLQGVPGEAWGEPDIRSPEHGAQGGEYGGHISTRHCHYQSVSDK